MHLVIYFCGTGNDGKIFSEQYNYAQPNQVKTIFVEGSDTPDVCDSAIFPNLSAFAKRFTKKAFSKVNERLYLGNARLSSLGIGVNHRRTTATATDEEITGITLCGYGRGAVTCFEVARSLKSLSPNVSVNIVADNPVPGNSGTWLFSNARSVSDCSDLTNVKHASIILGAYTGVEKPGAKVDCRHRTFFSQIVPTLPNSTDRKIVVIPREHHDAAEGNAPHREEYCHLELARRLEEINREYVVEGATERLKNTITTLYKPDENSHPAYFPDEEKLQPIFGLERSELYQYADPLHPCPLVRESDKWDEGTNYLTWWKTQNKKASMFSSPETRELEKVIKLAQNFRTVENLTLLFQKADYWLLQKEGSKSSRYEIVERLRANALDELTRKKDVKKEYLVNMHAENIRMEGFIFKHWSTASKQASFFKTDETRELDRAFADHRDNRKTDQELLIELNKWIDAKRNTKSKRYHLVESIKHHIQEVIKAEQWARAQRPENIPS